MIIIMIMIDLSKTLFWSVADEDHSRNDCLVVFVLTHGQDGQVHAHDVTYKPSSLWNQFSADKCRTLAGKPKMFFIQV